MEPQPLKRRKIRNEIQPTITPTQEQIAFFQQNGYLAPEGISTPEEVARMRAIYDRLFA